MFDLDLVASYKVQYSFANFIHYSFPADFDLAKSEPPLEYDPLYYEYSTSQKNPEKNRRQGIPVGTIDNMIEALLKYDNHGNPQVLSLGEFTRLFTPTVNTTFATMVSLFIRFHPSTSPVLWRILLAQAHIYQSIITSSRPEELNITLFEEEKRRKYFDWRQSNEKEISDDVVLRQPFKAVKNYFNMVKTEYIEQMSV